MNKLNVILLVLALLSGLAVVTVQDQSRQYYISLDKAQKHEIQLDQDYARLKLEQAKLSNHKLIKEAAEKQKLQPPSAADTRMIEMK
ncbi:cell division protein FtsL [Neisseria sp. Dent CA1/247]|uniref:Cell division protein FtsL n=1 Tax=Neisseria dumasiana TaxID=1931275 RepID=A0A1X3DJI1_9NEIS|nr:MULTISPECIES: cell division protein FtsL [Neisseria]MDO1509744.1 cell division protein FtsL [Neisseria sp. MVDL19-042950]MDO1515932.1 cell division protein FtsL [Neisseria sp. MVDL18-041461]MDO1563045.1 cell division protein FtsL [Neisseria sp. MVDL20-010259]MDO5070527.1 cell division protein FtsL [Neisseria zoodegmatis]OSI21652.1 cell division protein FtsL [Neisseria dumasiana]